MNNLSRMKAVVLSSMLNDRDELRIELVSYTDVLLVFKGEGYEHIFKFELYKLVEALRNIMDIKQYKRFFHKELKS